MPFEDDPSLAFLLGDKGNVALLEESALGLKTKKLNLGEVGDSPSVFTLYRHRGKLCVNLSYFGYSLNGYLVTERK